MKDDCDFINDKYIRFGMTKAIMVAASVMVISVAALAQGPGPRVIKNPYGNVNWDQVQTYRANFHSHTVLSDGRSEPDELIYMYADAGYHILAITDHDNYYTHRDGERDVIRRYIHRDEHKNVPTSETTWPWSRWIDEEPATIWVYQGIESSAFYPDLGDEGMLAVRAVELTTHPHMVSLFNRCGWPSRDQSNDERMRCVEEHDGLAFWVHPTHYLPGGSWEDRYFDDPNREEAVTFFGDHIINYDNLLGFEISTSGDRLIRDRELFDLLLQRYAPEHDIFIKGSDDTHATSVGENATLTLILAESLTEEAVRHALKSGHTFAGSRSQSYPSINDIAVDEQANTITLDIDRYEQIRWIINGEEFSTGTLLDFSEITETAVRFEVDQGGVTFYSQAFYIQ